MSDRKYKDVPRHKAVIEYENAFKNDFRKTVTSAVSEIGKTMLTILKDRT